MKKVTICVGIPGSGKSTWVKETAPKGSVVLNADSIRKELYGDENIQGNGATVFMILNNRFKAALVDTKVKNIYVDNTSTSRKARKELLSLVEKHCPDCQLTFKVFDDFKLARERNKNRDRVVPEEVMDRMENQFQEPAEDETPIKFKIEKG